MKELLDFWFAEGLGTWRRAWFVRDPAFDAELGARFATLADAAANGAHDELADTPEGALALALLLDQLPRNLHRGSPAAFAQDAKARDLARRAVLARGFDRALPPAAATFLYLPFEHSEALADQNVAVALFEGMRDVRAMAAPGGAIDYAWRHRAVILRFGRFPHRNAALGRVSTAAEEAWLAAGGGF